MKITFTNRLSVLLRERQISSASEFGRRMTADGFPMSSSHASLYEKDTAPAFDLKFINAACNILQCLPNDLYNITIELDEDEALDPTLALPRHAVVIRTKPGSEAAPSSALVQTVVVETPPVSRKAPQKSSEKAARPTAARSATTDEETGPSGVLFPYIKKN